MSGPNDPPQPGGDEQNQSELTLEELRDARNDAALLTKLVGRHGTAHTKALELLQATANAVTIEENQGFYISPGGGSGPGRGGQPSRCVSWKDNDNDVVYAVRVFGPRTLAIDMTTRIKPNDSTTTSTRTFEYGMAPDLDRPTPVLVDNLMRRPLGRNQIEIINKAADSVRALLTPQSPPPQDTIT